MIKKLSLCLLAISAGFAASCTNPFYVNSVRRAENWQPKIQLPSSVVVCRQKQCAPAKLSMSREYIYNSLLHLLDNNSQNKALLCRADSASHICVENYLTVPVTVGVTPANMYIDDVKITDVSASIGNKSLNVILNYNVTYNGQTPTCKPAKSLVYVKNANNIVMEDAGYICKMTTIGNTTIKTLFAIDYIDLDYGYIGGYYSIGLSGPAFGGDSGYMMMRLPQDAYPLSPDLILKEEPKQEQTPTQAQAPIAVLDANGNIIHMQPMPQAPVTMPQMTSQPVPANATPVPMTIDANGNPVPVVFDENGKPIVLQMSHTTEVANPFAPVNNNAIASQQVQTQETQQQNKSKPASKKKAAKKNKRKAKNSSDIETKVTTSIVPMEERQELYKPKPKESKPTIDEPYEGVKVFPLPMKKKDASTNSTAKPSTLKEEIAKENK